MMSNTSSYAATSADTLVDNPFPGLRSFDIWENHLFFGRDEQLDTLLRKLADHRFVCVVGTSGSGKSSLVRAGLLPVLFGGFLASAGSAWRVAIFRPGNDPLNNLAHALSAPEVFGGDDENERALRTAMAEATLESSSLGLVQLVRQAQMESDENLLIVVDQFEELFRFKESNRVHGAADQAAAFVKLLLAAAGQRELPIYIVITVRSDFLGDCAQYRDLPEAINDGQYLIPRLQREQQRLAITGPVAVGGGKIAPRLVQQLLNDVGDNPDQLPILQHALMRTWEAWTAEHEEGEPIDMRHYDAIGGMTSALSKHADEAYNELHDDRSRHIAESLFKTLTELGPDNRGIRRPTSVATVCEVAGASVEEVVAVVDVFRRPGRSFIMPPAGVAITAETTLDISHESLMRIWERLNRWVMEDAESARIYRRLVESAALYEDGNAGLWRDPELQLAVDWRDRSVPNPAWARLYDPSFDKAMAFLDASVRDREIEQAEHRRRRWIARGAVAAFVLSAAILSAWALSERGSATANAREAQHARSVAEQQSNLAQQQARNARRQRAQAEQNYSLAQQQRRSAEQQRIEAERQRALAETQKREALAQRQRAQQFGQQAVSARDAAEAERVRALEQKQIAERAQSEAQAAERNALRLRLLSIGRSLAVKAAQMNRDGEEALAALLALQGYRFMQASGAGALDPDAYAALSKTLKPFQTSESPMMRAHAGGVRMVAYNTDGSHFASAGADGRLLLWDAANPQREPHELARQRQPLRAVTFDADGRTLAYGGEDGRLHLVAIAGGTPKSSTSRSSGIIALAFVRGDRVATLGPDGRITIWSRSSLEPEALPFDGALRSLASSRDGRVLAAGATDGRVVLWDLRRASAPRIIAGGRSVVQSLALSSDGRFIAVGLADGSVRQWPVDDVDARPVSYSGHRSPVHALAFNQDGSLLATAGADATVRLFSTSRPDDRAIVINDHRGWVWSVAFAPDGRTLASSGYDRTVRLFPTEPETLSKALESRLTRNLTRTEWEQYIGSDIPYQKTVARLADG